MTGSVNWYFDNLDAAMDHTDVKNFLSLIEYGNQNINSVPELLLAEILSDYIPGRAGRTAMSPEK